jgi:hypothetical protein
LTAQSRIVPLFDSGKERVHIQMKNDARHRSTSGTVELVALRRVGPRRAGRTYNALRSRNDFHNQTSIQKNFRFAAPSIFSAPRMNPARKLVHNRRNRRDEILTSRPRSIEENQNLLTSIPTKTIDP